MSRTIRMLLVAAATVSATAACGGGVPTAQVFTAGSDPTCLVHQKHDPTAPYRGGPGADTENELRFLAYYTRQGRQSFCDGNPASARDRRWGVLYIQLTGNRAAVKSLI